MAYLIGWRDLQAASMVVPAMQVLDYVSPRTLEDFEAQLEQELDDEKEKLEDELKSDLVAPQKKKRGRPPAHSQIKSAVVAEPETVAQAKSRHKKGVMSLSTPQKSKLEDFDWLSDEEGSPSRQIAEEQFQSLHGYLPDEDDDVVGDTDDPLPSDPSRAVYSAAPQTSYTRTASVPLIWKQSSASPKSLSPTRIKISPTCSSGGVQALAANKHSLPTAASSVKESSRSKQPFSLPSSSFTPARPIERQIPPSGLGEGDKTDQSIPAKPKPKKAKKRPRPEDESTSVETQGDNGWVVERIEDVEYYEIDGRGIVRYFRVSWEGDWPPDQKRTWEPEENIPANLVRNFFKTSKHKRRAMSRLSTVSRSHARERGNPEQSSSSKQHTHKQSSSSLKQSRLSWPAVRKQYRSVSEAFAGDQDCPEMMDEGYDGEEGELSGGGQDEFFVVTEGGDDEVHGRSLWSSAGALSSALGVFRGFR
jgi:hypothetical protein